MSHQLAFAVLLCLVPLGAACTSSHDPADSGSTMGDGAADAGRLTDAGSSDTGVVDAAGGDAGGASVTVPASEMRRNHTWMPGGQSSGYTASPDPVNTVDGEPSVVLEAPEDAELGMWAATTATSPIVESQWGTRLRMRVQIKTEVAGAAFAWLRIDLADAGFVLDNMSHPVDRAIYGTADWHEVELVLDLPTGAHQVAFGSGLRGAGRVWLGPVTLEEVGPDVPTTPYFTSTI